MSNQKNIESNNEASNETNSQASASLSNQQQRRKTADTVINIIAMLGIAPAFILLVVYFVPDSNLSLDDIIEPHIGSFLFAALFMFGSGLCIYIANPHKLIFLLPLLSIAILPALSSGHAEEEVVTVFTGELSLAKGFTNYGSNYELANYRCDTQGVVSLHGLISGNNSLKGEYSIAVLPEACRPTNRMIFALQSHSFSTNPHTKTRYMMTRVDILPNGEVRFEGNGGRQPQWLSLNGIVFHLKDKIEIENAEL